MSNQPFLPYGRQWVDEADIAAVVEVLRGDFLTTGPAVGQFEQRLAAATATSHAVACNSGTSALHMMYAAMGVGQGDEIITSPLTFAATANAAHYLGATVKFVDVTPDTGNLDPDKIAAAITPRTKLIVPVDFGGHPADYDAIHAVAAAHNLPVAADAAHSLGATYHGRPVGTLAAATEVSLHPVKPITTAEGGAVLTADAGIAERAARFRTHGITRDPALLSADEGPWFYEQLELGLNYRLTDVQAALGSSQLAKLDAFIARRQAIAARYNEALADLAAIELPTERPGIQSGWHLYAIRVRDAARRRALFERLRELGLGVQVHYLPVYRHPWYRANGYADVNCPVADDYYAREISVPVFPRMTDAEQDSAIERIRQAVSELL
jgi:UDP-4-amino-4,6-dideoxy-N-acetyl-beta-L-altrosamine transaminase